MMIHNRGEGTTSSPVYYSVLIMWSASLVGAFNQERALSRDLFRDYTPLFGPSFEALVAGAGAGGCASEDAVECGNDRRI